jgi:hypothetical protein
MKCSNDCFLFLAANIRSWVKEIEELQTVKIKFPIMSDPTCTVLKMVGRFRFSPIVGLSLISLISLSNSSVVEEIISR